MIEISAGTEILTPEQIEAMLKECEELIGAELDGFIELEKEGEGGV